MLLRRPFFFLSLYLERNQLTLKAVRVEEVFALFMALDAAFCATDSLAGDAPQEALTLVAIGRGGGRPRLEVVRSRAGYRVDQTLERLLVDVHFL